MIGLKWRMLMTRLNKGSRRAFRLRSEYVIRVEKHASGKQKNAKQIMIDNGTYTKWRKRQKKLRR